MLSTAGYHGAEPGYHEPESELDKKVSATSFRSALTRDQEHQVNELYDAVEGDLQGEAAASYIAGGCNNALHPSS